MRGWFASIAALFAGVGAGGESAVGKAIDLVGEKIEDVNKRNDLIVELVRLQAQKDMQATMPWIDGALKLLDHLLWYVVIAAWIWSVHEGKPFDISQVGSMLAGPSVFSLLRVSRR